MKLALDGCVKGRDEGLGIHGLDYLALSLGFVIGRKLGGNSYKHMIACSSMA